MGSTCCTKELNPQIYTEENPLLESKSQLGEQEFPSNTQMRRGSQRLQEIEKKWENMCRRARAKTQKKAVKAAGRCFNTTDSDNPTTYYLLLCSLYNS